MKLSNSIYNDLMENGAIALATQMLKRFMLNRSESGLEKERKRIDNFRKDLNDAIKILEGLVKSDLLLELLRLERNNIAETLRGFQDYQNTHVKNTRVRIGKNYIINMWMRTLIHLLISNGLKTVSQREDFVLKFIVDNNLEGYKFTELNKEDQDYQIRYTYKLNEENIRRTIRKNDKIARDQQLESE